MVNIGEIEERARVSRAAACHVNSSLEYTQSEVRFGKK